MFGLDNGDDCGCVRGRYQETGIIRMLRERDYLENTARPIANWRIKDLVWALIQTNVGRSEDSKDSEDEDLDDEGDSGDERDPDD